MKWMGKPTNFVCASSDDQPVLYGVVSDRKDLFVMGLVFVGWVRSCSSIPAKLGNQSLWRVLGDSTTHIMSILSSPTLAKIFSLLWFQSTSYAAEN